MSAGVVYVVFLLGDCFQLDTWVVGQNCCEGFWGWWDGVFFSRPIQTEQGWFKGGYLCVFCLVGLYERNPRLFI